jgi:C4-dicarboxylate-specific signal transduction histidine kinase
LNLVEADARAEGIAILTDLAADLPFISGDLIQLQQVLMNLTRNAVDAMRDGPNKDEGILIRTRRLSEGEVQVSVLDHGPGVPPQLAKSIFLPFVTTKRDGLGVGLAISRTIIRAHDGELFCRRNPIGGAIFGFNLPVARRG